MKKITKTRVKYKLPIHIPINLIGSSVVLAVSFALLILWVVSSKSIISPYYLICAMIISSGLLGTAIASIKDWNDFIHKLEIERIMEKNKRRE